MCENQLREKARASVRTERSAEERRTYKRKFVGKRNRREAEKLKERDKEKESK